MKTNIVLIGFMGSGKTTIGIRLAYKLKYLFIDTDKKIEEEMGISINEIFRIYGEQYFRNLEKTFIKKLSNSNKQVIATGGGIIKNKQNIEELKSKGIIIYLNASPEHIYNNIKDDDSRPLLQVENKMETIQSILNERKFLYEEFADIIIDISYNQVDEITQIIIDKLGGKIF